MLINKVKEYKFSIEIIYPSWKISYNMKILLWNYVVEIFPYIAQIGEKKENNGRQVVSDFNDIVFITGVLLLSGLGHGDLRS